ncbi:Holliday junction resolvase RuvX [Candidatus Parabeggiatoa sp. HSG14]|uniref:Holliday junction resolvase RuvX n=1 Tax=Candidatus Parabeggiatoa sp. HSG14 TaxID=3055593 RepID=UPI0025A70F9C|nr:Holliday junction resolvase RuvX [Thiotrichales bacterium HSG14]
MMGFDYGSKRIGVAVGQTLTTTASPLAIVQVKNQKIDWACINALVQEWQPDAFVVGLPLHADGSDNLVTIAVRRFCRQLQERYQLPVHTIDEMLSSVAAAEQLKDQRKKVKGKNINPSLSYFCSPISHSKKGELDDIAAQIILETWFTECL